MIIVQLPRLDITNQFAKIGLEQHKPNIEVKQHLAEIKIKQKQPEMEIIKTKSKLLIDQSEAFADADVMSPLRRTKEWVKKALQAVQQDIAGEMSEGRRLMKIENKNNTIPEIAKANTEPPQKYSNIKFIPETPEKVKFDYTPSVIDIKIKQNKPEVEAETKSPTITYHPWDLKIYLKQKPSITFKVVGSLYDKSV